MPSTLKMTKKCPVALVPLVCFLLSTSVFARQRCSFMPPRENQAQALSSILPVSLRLKTQDVSTFPSRRHAEMVTTHTSVLIAAVQLCRGGYQYDNDNYYDNRDYKGNDDDYYSKQYNDDDNFNNDDNYFYDDRGPSVRLILLCVLEIANR